MKQLYIYAFLLIFVVAACKKENVNKRKLKGAWKVVEHIDAFGQNRIESYLTEKYIFDKCSSKEDSCTATRLIDCQGCASQSTNTSFKYYVDQEFIYPNRSFDGSPFVWKIEALSDDKMHWVNPDVTTQYMKLEALQ